MAERDLFEKNRLGGYTMIFPCKNEARNKDYEAFIKKANDLWDDFTTGNKQKKAVDKKAAVRTQGMSKLQTQTTLTVKRNI
jgi:hypothetical protein